jgi:hypothetical protein
MMSQSTVREVLDRRVNNDDKKYEIFTASEKIFLRNYFVTRAVELLLLYASQISKPLSANLFLPCVHLHRNGINTTTQLAHPSWACAGMEGVWFQMSLRAKNVTPDAKLLLLYFFVDCKGLRLAR